MKNKKVLFIDKWGDVCEGIIIENNFKHENLPPLDRDWETIITNEQIFATIYKI